jgi:hypothetical protein
VNRFDIRRWRTVATLAVAALLGGAVLVGCSSGQIAQTAEEVSAVNGASTSIKNLSLRNVYIQATQTTDYLQAGQTVKLVLVVTNESADIADKLTGITSDIGTVTVSGNAQVPARGLLFVGAGDSQNTKAAAAVDGAGTAKATVALTKPITNGMTYNFTFDFEKAGSASLPVPIAAPTAQP